MYTTYNLMIEEIKTDNNCIVKAFENNPISILEEDLDKISEINKEMNHRIDDSELAENILWVPKTLEFSNMFSYGEGNKVRFENAQGVIGIFAPNASGKSSLFDALSFCIFDKTSRSSSSKNILNNQKDNFYCKFNFEIDGVDYFIERSARWTRKGTNLSVNVNFWKEDAGVTTSLNGEQRRDTNKNIERYLGKFEDFVLTSLSLQGNNALFIDKSQSERKDLLAQFMGINVFDKLYDLASEDIKEVQVLLRNFKRTDFTSELATAENKLETLKDEYEEFEIEKEGYEDRQDDLNEEITNLSAQLVPIDGNLDITELESKQSTLQSQITGSDATIQTKSLSIGKIMDVMAELTIAIDSKKQFNGIAIEDVYSNYQQQQKDLIEAIEKAERRIKREKKEKEKAKLTREVSNIE